MSLFQPSQFYGLAALAGVAITVAVRMLAVRFNWRTRAVTLA
jgi:hypothetical protein